MNVVINYKNQVKTAAVDEYVHKNLKALDDMALDLNTTRVNLKKDQDGLNLVEVQVLYPKKNRSLASFKDRNLSVAIKNAIKKVKRNLISAKNKRIDKRKKTKQPLELDNRVNAEDGFQSDHHEEAYDNGNNLYMFS